MVALVGLDAAHNLMQAGKALQANRRAELHGRGSRRDAVGGSRDPPGRHVAQYRGPHSPLRATVRRGYDPSCPVIPVISAFRRFIGLFYSLGYSHSYHRTHYSGAGPFLQCSMKPQAFILTAMRGHVHLHFAGGGTRPETAVLA
jgi:hypothetical protein